MLPIPVSRFPIPKMETDPRTEPGIRHSELVDASISRSSGEAPLCPLRHLSPLSPTHPQKAPNFSAVRSITTPRHKLSSVAKHKCSAPQVCLCCLEIVRTKGTKGPQGTKGSPHRCLAPTRHPNQKLLPSERTQCANSQAPLLLCPSALKPETGIGKRESVSASPAITEIRKR